MIVRATTISTRGLSWGTFEVPQGTIRTLLTPFVTGGYTLGYRGQTVNAVKIGGGANYWISDTLGLRFEFAHHLPVIDRDVRDEHLPVSHFVRRSRER